MPQRPRGQRELAVTADCLRELSARVLGAREDERRLLARELHDEVGQRLTAIKLGLMGMAEDGGPGIQDDRLNALIQLVEGTVNSVRRLSADLRPLMLDDLGLPDAIEWLARDAAQRLDLEVTVRFFNPELEIRDPAATALYRIVQEALANVGRHAQATDVRIELLREGNELVLTVEDNGTGFPEGALDAGQALGLLGMCERAHMLGGHLELSNPPGSGGRVQVRTPLGGQSWDLNANSPTVWSQPIPPP